MDGDHGSMLWKNVVEKFDWNPRDTYLNSRLKPAMTLLSNVSVLEEISQKVENLGLVPLSVQARAHSDLIGHLPNHYAIDGASDASLNFWKPVDLPIRISLKLSFHNPAVRVNLRPVSNLPADQQAFLLALGHGANDRTGLAAAYLGALPIRRPGDPYFKPFARDGIGNSDTPFPIDGSPVLVDTNWLEAPSMISLYEALSVMFNRVRNH
jgi:hypothetical protein